jgi:uncharacterized protein (TIGR03437 family)
MCKLFISVCLPLISLGPLFGQGATLTGSGYSDPSIINVAPGQVTTLFVTGLKTVLSSQPVSASALPLPAALAGISVTLDQTGGQPTPVPLLSVRQISTCTAGSASGCLITAVTIQVPFELLPPPSVPELVVSEDAAGGVGTAFKVVPSTDKIHVINTCDVFPPVPVTSQSFCSPLVTHADGTLVGPGAPAKPGEEVVVWAFGLGETAPAAKTGEASPLPAATVLSRLYVQFDFRINAAVSPPYIDLSAVPVESFVAPVFAGLTPGQVGLYQINVRIPDSTPAAENCGLPTGTGDVNLSIYNFVQSNLTIDIGGNSSFDGAAICFASGQQPSPGERRQYLSSELPLLLDPLHEVSHHYGISLYQQRY